MHSVARGVWSGTSDDLNDSRVLAQCHHIVCRAAGYYGQAFKAGRGVTQGGPLSAKLFNIVVDAVVWELMRQLQQEGDYDGEQVAEFIATFFAIFYVNNTYLASQDAGFLQHALTLLVNLFK